MSSAPPSFSGAATLSIERIHCGPRNASRLHHSQRRAFLSRSYCPTTTQHLLRKAVHVGVTKPGATPLLRAQRSAAGRSQAVLTVLAPRSHAIAVRCRCFGRQVSWHPTKL